MILFTLNRILLVLCVIALFIFILLLSLPIGSIFISIIGLIVPFIAFLFSFKQITQIPWFDRLLTTIILNIIFIILIVLSVIVVSNSNEYDLKIASVISTVVVAANSNEYDLKIASIDPGGSNDGKCSLRCTIIVSGEGISRLQTGQNLAVYGPYAKLIEGGIWSEAPIAVIRVLGKNNQIAFAQLSLIHEASERDDSKQIKSGLSVLTQTNIITDFLVPAFGHGYVYQENIVYLRPGTKVSVGDYLITLRPETQGFRIVDQSDGDTEVQIIRLGQEGISAQVKVVSGPPLKAGDIVQIDYSPISIPTNTPMPQPVTPTAPVATPSVTFNPSTTIPSTATPTLTSTPTTTPTTVNSTLTSTSSLSLTNTPTSDAIISVAELKLRRGPSVLYGVIRIYVQNTNVKVLGKEATEQWFEVELPDGQRGWMFAGFLTVNISISSIPVVTPPSLPTSRPTIKPPPTKTPTATQPPINSPIPSESPTSEPTIAPTPPEEDEEEPTKEPMPPTPAGGNNPSPTPAK